MTVPTAPGGLAGLVPPPSPPPRGRRPAPDNALARRLDHWASMPNIAKDPAIGDRLERITQRVKREYDIDENSRNDWKDKYRKWLDFAMQVAEEKVFPWPQAANVIYPLITVAALQFSARAYPAIIRDRNVVKGVVIGDDTGELLKGPQGEPVITSQGPHITAQPGEKQERADRIGGHMSWQLLDEQEEWEPQTDQLLIILPIVGCMFRKSYFSPVLGRNISETVDAMRLCVNYRAKSFETAPRHTEIIPMLQWDIETNIRAGLFLDEDYGHDTYGDTDYGREGPGDQNDEDAPTTFLEQHRRLDLDGDGYPEPYIATIARDSNKLARIRAAWDMETVHWTRDGEVERIEPIPYYTKYGFIPSPESKVYDIGFGHLLHPINESVNTALNQMFDAGTLQNAGGGFVGSGLSINTGAVRFQVGEYKPVNTMGGNIRDNVFPIPFPGPSQGLMALLEFLVNAGERIAAVKDIMTGDMPGDNTSGITTLAVIEQGLQVFSSIYKRVYRSLGYEFRKLYRLNRIYLPRETEFKSGDQWFKITRADYERGAGVEPVSDPRMVTDMQRLGRAQFLLQFKDDAMMDGVEIRREALNAAMIPNASKFLLKGQPPPPPQFALKDKELNIRAAREQGDLQLRAWHDRALMLREVAQAELFLAQTRKVDNDAQLGWVEQHLEALKLYVDSIANAAGGESGPGAPPGANAGAVPAMAPPPGLGPGTSPLPAGLPGAG
jgi:chaperonin GroES